MAQLMATRANTAGLLRRASSSINRSPDTRASQDHWRTGCFRPSSATTEWGLPTASTPVSASKRSLLRFSHSSNSTAANRKPRPCSQRTGAPTDNRQPAANSTGITATEYIGHLIAAFHNRLRSRGGE